MDVLTFCNKKGYNEYNNRDTKLYLVQTNVNRHPVGEI